MSDPSLPKIDPIAYIRTYVPYLWGLLLGWAITTIPVVANAVSFLDSTLPAGVDWRGGLNLVLIALVTAGYYWLARQIGRRWPAAEKWLVGSSSQPLYVERDKSGRFE